MQYHIWTLGCQMNVADSQLLASELEKLGHSAAGGVGDDADIMIVNTCVVRQSAEDKGLGRLQLLRKIKEAQPEKVIGVMGCMVGVRDPLVDAAAPAFCRCLHAAIGSDGDGQLPQGTPG